MPDKRSHRGAHPQDARLFAPEALRALRSAAADMAWLLDRGYASKSTLKLVGDRYDLTARQRTAVARCSCDAESCEARRARQVVPAELNAARLHLDGYNVLTTVEAALGGGVLLLGRDGCLRDMASMHGSYRKVAETVPAAEAIGRQLAAWGVAAAVWYLDSPVSNSGRLKGVLSEVAAAHGWDWTVELVTDPDPRLAACRETIATSDSAVLDRCRRWANLARATVESACPKAWVVEL